MDSTRRRYIDSHLETHDNFDYRLLTDDVMILRNPTTSTNLPTGDFDTFCTDLVQSNDFSRSVSVTSPPPRRNGTLSPTSGLSTGGRKTPTVLIEERTRSFVMSNDREHMYFPAGYTRCDLKAGRMNVPQFKVTNERAWANPTPTPWGRDKVQLSFSSQYNSSNGHSNMPGSSKGVVGKFRSLYSTIEQVKAAFSKYDANRDGNISLQELEDGMVQSGEFSFDDAREAFEIADINGDGEIDIGEFVQVMFPTAAEIIANLRKSFNSMEDVEATFRQWDLNKDGAISFTELEKAVAQSGRKLSAEEMNAIFVIGDVDQNGEIDLEEFKKLMIPNVSDVVAKFRSTHPNMKDVQNAFRKFDRNGDGAIDRSELTSALTSSGQQYTQQEVNALFNAADVNKDGTIDFEEFVALMCPSASDIVSKFRAQYTNIDSVRAAFKRFDRNGDGALSIEELSSALKSSGLSFSDSEVTTIFNMGDVDGDGEITMEEFVALMSPSASEVLNKVRRNFKNIADIKSSFKRIDTNNDGLLSKSEMLNSSGCKFDKEEVDAIFELGDVNGDGEIDMGEFIGLMYPAATEILSKLSLSFKNLDEVKAAFRLLDQDGDGSITRQEMGSSSHRFSSEQIESIFALGDVNDDGAIDLEEFISVMCPSAEIVVSRLSQKYKNINEVKRAFMSMDANKDGKISRSEMSSAGKLNAQEVDAVFILGDVNGDGEIDLEEFIGLLCPSAMEALQKFTKSIKNIQEAQMLFRILDKNGDGMISMEELQSCGQKFSKKEVEAIFAIGDTNGDGEIDVDEFVAVMCPSASTVVQRISKSFKSLNDIKSAFQKLDRDGDGQISRQELNAAGYNAQEVEAVFNLGDANNDGQIDMEEFITVMCPSASSVVFKVSKMFKDQKSAQEAFNRIDINRDGKISRDEMKNASLYNGSKLNPIEVEAIFALGDVNKDGEIDLQEFMSVMLPSAGFSSSFSSSNTQFRKVTSSSSSSKQSLSSVQTFSSSAAQSYSSTTTYSSTTVSISFSNAGEVKRAFSKFDANGDGHLDKNELKQLLKSCGKSANDQEVDLLFRQGDVDGDGLIDIQEFVKLMFPAASSTLSKLQQKYSNLNDVKAAFRKFDADGDGHITRSELKQVMQGFNDQEVDAIFAMGDKDQSGGIDYQEFVAMMIPNCAAILKQVSTQFSSVQAVRDAFLRIDANGDGAISRQELKNGMRLNDNAVDVIFAIGDSNQDNEISMPEFLRLMLPSASSAMNRLRNSFRDIAEVIVAFKKFDANNDGSLSLQELSRGIQGLGLDLSPQEVSSIFTMADTNQDNEINYVEFVSFLFPAAADGLAKFRSRLGAITDVKVAFKRFDADGDGSISVLELKNGAGAGFTSGEIAAVFALGDSDQDGSISFAEFAQLVLPSARDKVSQLKKSFSTPNDVQAAFNRFDVNRDGKISCEELRNGLTSSGLRMNDQEVMTVFAIADVDGDGEISLNEFLALMGFGQVTSSRVSGSNITKVSNIHDVKTAFRKFDINNDGHLDQNEFRQFMTAIQSGGNSDALFRQADVDGDGKVDYQELIRLMFPESAKALTKLQGAFRNLNEVKSAFKKFDSDGDGHVSKSELQQVMSNFSSAEVDAIFALGDKDQSGGIDYQEFIGLMLPSAPSVIARLAQNFRSITNIKESFKRLDANGDQQISRGELKNGMKLTDSDLDVVFALGDLDGDGEISMSEFICIMSPVAAKAVSRFRNCFKNIQELVTAFRQFDSNADGSISMNELAAGMRNMRMSFSNEETNAIYAASDINQDGEISYTEFVSLMIPTAGDALSKFRKAFSGIKNAKEAFDRFDADGDEEISMDELRAGMGNNFSANEVAAVFSLGDTDQDGKISFLEFAKLMIPSAADALAKFWKCFRDLKVIRQAFKQFDTDNDGSITRKEIMDGMTRSGRNFTADEIDALLILADRDNNGAIDFPEFALIMIPSAPERLSKLRKKYRSKAEVEGAFRSFDANNDGAIDFNEMRVGLQKSGILLTDQEIETIFALADVDGDGSVSMGEFVALMCPGSNPAPAAIPAATNSSASGLINKFRSQFRTVEDVRRAFNTYDANRDGSIDRRELTAGMTKAGQFSQSDASTIFELADADGNGEIDIGEFVCLMFPNAASIVSGLKQNFRSAEDVRAAFNSWDTNRDGQISFQELKQAVQRTGQNLNDEQISALFVIGDADQNGEIDLDEFMKMMMPGTSDVVAKFRSIRKTVRDVQQAFKQFDKNGDGSIDRKELTSALASSGGNFTQQEIDVIFTAADVDGNGEIDYEEFIALMCPSASDIVEKFRSKYKSVNEVKAAFKLFDRNGDGALSKDELASAMKSSGESYSDIEVNAIFSLGDIDGDGEITLEEFVGLMSPSATQVVNKLRKNFKNLNDVKSAFKKIDTNNDGLLSKNEMMNAGKFDIEEVNAIFDLGDVNNDGEIDMGEFIGVLYPSAVEVAMEVSSKFRTLDDVKAAFKLLDKDGDGSISRQEMASSGHRFNASQVEAIFALGDINDDGAIDLDEFVSVMCPSALTVISRLRSKYSNLTEVKKAFLAIDTNRDGLLSKSEIASSGKFNSQEVESIFILGDINQDGEIDLEEFVGLMSPTAAMAIARLSRNVKNIAEAQQLFSVLDKNGDGLISQEEMRACGSRFNAQEIEAIFAIGDVNNDGEIDFNEFIGVMCPSASTVVGRITKGFKTLEDIKQGFNKLDRDGDGRITKSELSQAGYSDQEVNAVFALGDINQDGEIDMQEFITVMCPSAVAVVTKVASSFKDGKDIASMFKKIDINGDGLISKGEMKSAVFGTGKLTQLEVDAIFQLGDINKDGEIDINEFMAVMSQSAQTFSSSSSTSITATSSKSMTMTSSFSSSFSSTTTKSSFSSVGMTFGSVHDAKAAFKRFDINGDGVMDKEEMKQMLSFAKGQPVSQGEVDSLFKKGDLDGDGQIDMQEFVKLMFPSCAESLSKLQKSFNNVNDAKAGFRKVDSDGDGHISREELSGLMSKFSGADVDAVFALGDKDQSGGIDYNEFVALMIPESGSILRKISCQFNSIQQVIEGFKKLDANQDGALCRNEMKVGLRLNDQELNVLFALGDVDQDGEISLAEFVRLMSPTADSGLSKFRNSFKNIQEVVAAFKRFDSNADGAICSQELSNGIKTLGINMSGSEIKAIFALADTNQDGEISYCEFISSLFPVAAAGLSKMRGALKTINSVKEAFKRFDADNDGEISFPELKRGASSVGSFTDGELSAVFAVADRNGDGQISFAEFARMIIQSVDDLIFKLKNALGSGSDINQAFQKIDVNKDGKISLQELKNGLSSMGLKFTDGELEGIFAVADLDGDGEIDVNEFEHLLGTSVSLSSVEDVKAAFYRFDQNNDGSIDKNELKLLLTATGKTPSQKEVDDLFRRGDLDNDGKIDIQEFIKLMFPASINALAKIQAAFKSMNEIKSSFRKYDIDGDGHISKLELRKALSKFSEAEVESVFALGDADQSGGIDYQEFIGLMMPNANEVITRLSSQFRSVMDIKSAFKRLDANGDGQINRDELRNGMRLSDKDLDVVFGIGDLDGDGEINVGEFVRIMCPTAANGLARFRNSFSAIEDVVAAFRSIDMNNDGSITRQELASGMNNFGKKFTEKEIGAVFELGDVNSDGEINYTEFVSMMFPAAATALTKFRKSNQTLKNAKDAFDRFDIDGDGEITYEELVAGLGGSYSANEINALFAMGDVDQDGMISFIEFAKITIPSANETLSKFWKSFSSVNNVKQAFQKFDADRDGQISRQEVLNGMTSVGLKLTSDEIDTLFILGDKDNNGQIDFSEFSQIMIPSATERICKLKKYFRNPAEVEAAFRRFDSNHDGAISFQEMSAGLRSCGISFSDQEIETCFAVADKDCDGEVSLSEFVHVFSSSSAANNNGATNKFFNYCVAQAFSAIDTNQDGALSYQELAAALRPANFSDEDIHTIFSLADHDGDGEISLDELIRALRK